MDPIYSVVLSPACEAMPHGETCACRLMSDPVVESRAHKLVSDLLTQYLNISIAKDMTITWKLVKNFPSGVHVIATSCACNLILLCKDVEEDSISYHGR